MLALLVILATGPIVPPVVFPEATPTAAVCPGDINGDDVVTIDELVRAVVAALEGCE